MPFTDPGLPHCSLHNPNGEHDVVRDVCTRCGLGRFNAPPPVGAMQAQLSNAITAANAAVDRMLTEPHIKHAMEEVRQIAALNGEAAYRTYVELRVSSVEGPLRPRGQEALASMRLPPPIEGGIVDRLRYTQPLNERDEAREDLKFERSEVRRLKAEVMRLSRIAGVLAAQEQPGNIDYIGPTKPDPDKPGRRLPVADPVHEQFHRSVGDVLSSKVIPEARRQMQEALKNAPKEKGTIPTLATTMQIGLRLP